MKQDLTNRCQFCGQPEQIVWVHGHGQCAHCKINAFPCCDGDECIPVKAVSHSQGASGDEKPS